MFSEEGHESDAAFEQVRSARRDALVAFLHSIRRSEKTLDEINDNTDLVEAGMADSLSVIQTILYLEKTYDVDLSEHGVDPAALGTIGGILELIDRKSR